MMLAAVYDKYGGPSEVRIEHVPRPRPKDGEVLVRVHAVSINDWDLAMLRGDQIIIRAMNGLFLPKVRILGCDMAGRVEAVGANASKFAIGERVFGDLCQNGFGAFAQYVCAPETVVGRMPASMSYEEAAAIPQAGMLAVQGLIDAGKVVSMDE